MMNNEMNNNVVVAPVESQGMVQSIVNNQRVQGGAIVIGAALLGFAAYKAYKYIRNNAFCNKSEEGVIEFGMGSVETDKAAFRVKLTPRDKKTANAEDVVEAEAVKAEVVDEKK